MTGGRIKRAMHIIGENRFLLTYGDGLANIDITQLLQCHKDNKALVTLTAVQPEGRFGAIGIDKQERVTSFNEKPLGGEGWINGGFFVCEPDIFDFIEGDKTVFEKEPLSKLSKERKLNAYKHAGFWQCMDTMQQRKKR